MNQYKKYKLVYLFYNRLLKTTKAIKLVTLSKIQMIQASLKKRKYSLLHAKKLFESQLRISLDILPIKNVLIPITTERSCCGPIDQVLQNYTFKFISSFRSNYQVFFFATFIFFSLNDPLITVVFYFSFEGLFIYTCFFVLFFIFLMLNVNDVVLDYVHSSFVRHYLFGIIFLVFYFFNVKC